MPDPENAAILILDDNPANLDMLEQLLSSCQYQVCAVPSGRLCLDSARHFPPDLIMLDIKMPEMDGYEVCRTLKADPALMDIPVIFLSALDDVWDKAEAFRTGGADYITKPFQAEEVLARVAYQVQLRQRTRSLELAHQKLLEMDRMKERFTAMLVHDLRSPLTAISCALEMAQEEGGIPGDVLQAAQGAMESVMGLIKDLLDVFRTAKDELPLELQLISASELTRKAHRAHLPDSARRGIELELTVPPALPDLRADPRFVERALGNLLGNALKFTPRGGRVLLSADVREESGERWLTLSVKDSGRGIPVDKLSAVFEPFSQVLGRDAGAGVGLGLAIVQRIMTAHGGRASVQSQEGTGSTFTLQFPL